jgi:uncharacterized protein (DUF885 family)
MGALQEGRWPVNKHALKFSKLAKEYHDYVLRTSPVVASWLGDHRYDALFADSTEFGVARTMAKMGRFLDNFNTIDPKALDLDDRVDLEIVKGSLEYSIAIHKKMPWHKTAPDAYIDEVMSGIYLLMTREFAPAEVRAVPIIARLKKARTVLEHAKKNLANPPKVFTETSILSARGAQFFLAHTVADFAAKLSDPLKTQVLDAAAEANEAMKSFAAYLEGRLLKESRGKFAIGKRLFNLRLSRDHLLPLDAEKLHAIGEDVYKKTLAEIKKVAKQIDARRKWEDVVADLKKEHPTNEALVKTYADYMQSAKAFVKSRRLVDVPAGETIEVVPTPEFARSMIPYAAYLSPAPYEKEQKGIFWVTPVSEGTPPERAEEQLRGHSIYGVVVTSLHEAYPGHHLQLTVANKLKRPIRILSGSSVFAEGWALYCEDMMWEQGFYGDPRTRLLQLKDLLWRACRVIVDVSLHTGKMTFEQAVTFMVEKAHLERPNAETEVRRYCATPTQPMSYVIGKLAILDILKEYKKKHGAKFDLRKFHNHLLSHGTIAVSKVKELMLA